MNAYTYDKDTKEFKGIVEITKDPIRSELEGTDVYAYPLYCTNLIPDTSGENTAIFYNEDKKCWEYYEDHRGTTVYNKKNGSSMEIKELGPIPDGYVLEKPVILKEEKAKKIEEINVYFDLLKETKFQYEELSEIIAYRFQLKNMLATMGDVEYEIIESTNNEPLRLSKASLEKFYTFLTYVSSLISIRKAELIKAVNKCRSLQALEKMKIDVNIEEEAKKLMEKTREEVEEYFKNNTKGE